MNETLRRRRAMMGAEHKSPFLYDLDNSGFAACGLGPNAGFDFGPPNYPDYANYTANGQKRYSYKAFDLRLAGGKKYKFAASVANYQATAQFSPQFYNQTVIDAVNNGLSFDTRNIYALTWQPLECIVDVPVQNNGSNIVGARLTLRQSTSNPTIASDFAVERLTIEEVQE